MTDVQLPEIERMQTVDLQPGDILVVTLPEDATNEMAENVRALLAAKFPDQPMVVVTHGITIEGFRPIKDES